GAGDYNLYRYCHNDPVNRSDPTGLWSPQAHDKILEYALRDRLSKQDIAALQRASREFDKATQGVKDAYKHSMRERGESIQSALAKRDQFVNDSLKQARAAHQAGDHAGALKKLGEGLHPLMDSSSPMHTDASGNPKEWAGFLRSGWGHSPTDFIGKETSNQLTPS